jgi:hypothetical protein
MRTSAGRWLVAGVVVLSGFACADGAAPPVSGSPRPWTGVIKAHETGINGIALSADGSTLVTVGGDRLVVIDLRTGKALRQRSWKGHNVYYVTLVNAGKEIACVLGEEEVHLLDAQTLKTRAVINTDHAKYSGIDGLAASPDGRRLAILTSPTVGVWDVSDAKAVWRKPLGRSGSFSVRCVVFSPDGKALVAGVDHRELLRLLDAGTGRELRRLADIEDRRGFSEVGGLANTPGGLLVCAFARRNLIHVREPQTGKVIASMTWQTRGKDELEGVHSLAISADGKTLAVGALCGRLLLLETATGGLRRELQASDYGRAAFCPDGRLVRPDFPKRGQLEVSDWRRGAAKAGRLSDGDLKRACDGLGARDAGVGFVAASRLLAAPERQALALLAEVPRVEPLTDKQVARLIAGLDDDDPDVRERATEDLKLAGARAEKALRQVLAKPPSLEVKKRAAAILKNLTPLRPERLRFLRAVEILEAIATPAAMKQLERLAGGAAGSVEAQDARAALARVRHRPR